MLFVLHNNHLELELRLNYLNLGTFKDLETFPLTVGVSDTPGDLRAFLFLIFLGIFVQVHYSVRFNWLLENCEAVVDPSIRWRVVQTLILKIDESWRRCLMFLLPSGDDCR